MMQYQKLNIKDQKYILKIKNILRSDKLSEGKLCLSLICIFTFYYLIFYLVLSSPQIVNAQTSTPSADVKSKLEELKKEIATRAAKLKQEVSQRLQNKAYIGIVKSKSETSLTLETRLGPKTITINQDTAFESKVKTKQKSASWRTLAEEDYLAALGDIDDTGILIAKKIILLTPNPYTLNPKSYLWGKIISISDGLATIKNRDLKNIAVSISNVNIPNLKTSNFVILTGNFNKNDIFEAEFVYVIPQGGILKPKKIATPSAQVATKSATPKPAAR